VGTQKRGLGELDGAGYEVGCEAIIHVNIL